MKTIHFGQDYCKVVIGCDEYELPKPIGAGVNFLNNKITQRNKQIKHLKDRIRELEASTGLRTTIYSRDINPSINNDSFFGEGYEEMMKQAEENKQEIVVGYFTEKPQIER